MPAILSQHAYGKSQVRLTKVTRHVDRHDLKEVCVSIQLEGAFEKSYTLGDNSAIIPTDTMKNIVYALARTHPLVDLESFGQALAAHFVVNHAHVVRVIVALREQLWRPIAIKGEPHPHAFAGSGPEQRTSSITLSRDLARVESGLHDLPLLKTTASAFAGFLRDPYTTLAETSERLLATNLSATWVYARHDLDWNACHRTIRAAMLEAFAQHDSQSVQQTLHVMAQAALEACDQIEEITLTMPNEHRLLVDLRPFGLDNPNEIFVATAEPYGLITATLKRA